MRDGVVKLCCMYVNAIKYFSPEQFSSSMLSCELSGEKAFARVRCLRHLNIPNTITNAARRDRVVARAIKMDLDDPGDDDDDVEDPSDVAMVPMADMLNARYGCENVGNNSFWQERY